MHIFPKRKTYAKIRHNSQKITLSELSQGLLFSVPVASLVFPALVSFIRTKLHFNVYFVKQSRFNVNITVNIPAILGR